MARISDRRMILLIVALAALLRVPTAFRDMYHHPDELWQYLEPAYGMVTGRSVVTWEYRTGMRSWLIPMMLAGPVWLGKAIAPAGQIYLPLARLVAVALSLLTVGFGAAIALRRSRLHALVTGLVLATSFELGYFSARTLSETVSAALFVPAAWALLPHEGRGARRLLLGGVLLGLCVSARFQLAPALAVLAVACCGRDRRAWLPVIAGGLAGLAVDAAVDLLHGAAPFAWMLRNFRLNLVENRSAAFGIEPPWWFVATQLRVWGWAAAPVIVLALIGARRQPILLAVALANIAVHSLIPHKEYRFIHLSTLLLILLAGIGTAELLARARARRFGAVAAIGWFACSVATATSTGGREQWASNRRAIALMRAAHDEPGGCGLAYYRPEPDRLVAYSFYDRATPIYYFDRIAAAADARAMAPAYDMVVTAPDRIGELGGGYVLRGCFGADARDGRCLFVRPGVCRASDEHRFDVNRVLALRGE